jgi:predicted HTH transcriptional regulator
MRKLHISEEKGSGIDKVIKAAEVYQLPAPDFRAGEIRTTAILFAHQDFSDMNKADRIRACYQHCCFYISRINGCLIRLSEKDFNWTSLKTQLFLLLSMQPRKRDL